MKCWPVTNRQNARLPILNQQLTQSHTNSQLNSQANFHRRANNSQVGRVSLSSFPVLFMRRFSRSLCSRNLRFAPGRFTKSASRSPAANRWPSQKACSRPAGRNPARRWHGFRPLRSRPPSRPAPGSARRSGGGLPLRPPLSVARHPCLALRPALRASFRAPPGLPPCGGAGLRPSSPAVFSFAFVFVFFCFGRPLRLRYATPVGPLRSASGSFARALSGWRRLSMITLAPKKSLSLREKTLAT